MSFAEQLSAAIRALWQSVFAPRSLVRDKAAFDVTLKWGWALVVARWAYYSIIFQFRDYHGRWKPFQPPPFGLSIDAYAALQRTLALPFGLVAMLALTACTVTLLRHWRKPASFGCVFNILGFTYFLPFVLLQPLDQFVIALLGWQLLPIATLHTAALGWESWASAEVLNPLYGLSKMQRLQLGILLGGLWIGIAGPVWR